MSPISPSNHWETASSRPSILPPVRQPLGGTGLGQTLPKTNTKHPKKNRPPRNKKAKEKKKYTHIKSICGNSIFFPPTFFFCSAPVPARPGGFLGRQVDVQQSNVESENDIILTTNHQGQLWKNSFFSGWIACFFCTKMKGNLLGVSMAVLYFFLLFAFVQCACVCFHKIGLWNLCSRDSLT